MVNRNIKEVLVQTEYKNCNIQPITNDASNRLYYRIFTNQRTVILLDSTGEMNTLDSFIQVQSILKDAGLSVPEIIESNLPYGYLILEDLGQQTIYQFLHSDNRQLKQIYSNIIQTIIAIQNTTKLDNLPQYDQAFFLYEMRYFLSNYMLYVGKDLSSSRIDDFNLSWENVFQYLEKYDTNNVFVHKDLHASNLFWLSERIKEKNIGIIDFQAARKGSRAYDLTSVLLDCRYPITYTLRNDLFSEFQYHIGAGDEFKTVCDIWTAQRNIKILGNFAYLTMVKNNKSYLQYMDNVMQNVKMSLENPVLADLKKWMIDEKII